MCQVQKLVIKIITGVQQPIIPNCKFNLMDQITPQFLHAGDCCRREYFRRLLWTHLLGSLWGLFSPAGSTSDSSSCSGHSCWLVESGNQHSTQSWTNRSSDSDLCTHLSVGNLACITMKMIILSHMHATVDENLSYKCTYSSVSSCSNSDPIPNHNNADIDTHAHFFSQLLCCGKHSVC